MEKKKQNINPAVLGGVAAGAAVAGAAGTAAAQSFLDTHADLEQALHSGEPSLPADMMDEPAEAVIVDNDNDGVAVADVKPQSHTGQSGSTVSHEQHIAAYEDEVVAVEAVDPNDLDEPDMVEYGEVGVIVGENGVDQNYAMIEIGDDQLAMVDLDDDGVFDVITNEQGHAVMDLSAENKPAFTMSDAEVQLQEQSGQYEYMAQTEFDNNSDTSMSGDHYADDIVTV